MSGSDNYLSGCYLSNKTVSPGAWDLHKINSNLLVHGEETHQYNSFTLPTLLWQICISVGLVTVVGFILKPFRLPRIVTEIIVGILLGPSVLGRFDNFNTLMLIYPRRSALHYTMVGNLGMFLLLFLVGVQCNFGVISRLGKKVFLIAVSNLVIPLGAGMAACWIFGVMPHEGIDVSTYHIFITIIPCITAFPVVARLVTELKLLNTEMGKLALYSAVITDMFAWILVSVVVFLSSDQEKRPVRMALLFVLLSIAALVLVCWFVIRPLIFWCDRGVAEREQVSDQKLALVVATALFTGALLDAIGLHAIFGGVIIGLLVPKGALADALVNRLECFAAGVLLPVYFVSMATEVDLWFVSMIEGDERAAVKAVLGVFVVTMAAKLIGNMLIARLFSMRLVQGLTLGLLMCSKGQIELIFLDMGDTKDLYPLAIYSALILACILTTTICVPAAIFLSNSTIGRVDYRWRNLQAMRPDVELRVMTCIHSVRNIPGILTLLQLSHSSKQSPMFVGVLHLIELVQRSFAIVSIQENNLEESGMKNILMDSTQSRNQFGRIAAAFQSLERNLDEVSVQPQPVISPYSTMHNDICSLAEENNTTLIILPFHKIRTASGALQTPIPAAREVNLNVLQNAQCSIAILVDRGIGLNMRFETNNNKQMHKVAILFFGGLDDREAVNYALRLAGHPRVTLTLVRFMLDPSSLSRESSSVSDKYPGLTVIPKAEMEQRLDDSCITAFRLKTISDPTVVYTEINVKDSEETVVTIKSMKDYYDLYIVGKGNDRENSPILSGMMDWMEFQELGCIGDFLQSSDFGSATSILVLQQHIK